MRIAMIGLRGIPATYGGIERHVEELGSRLATRGHEVIVYCRRNYSPEGLSEYRGMKIVRLPAPSGAGIEALAHSALAAAHACRSQVDIAHFHALGPGLLTPVSRYLSHAGVVQTIHGLDHRRGKWGGPAQQVLRLGNWLSQRVPDEIVVVSEDLAREYARCKRVATFIPNGVPETTTGDPGLLREMSLRANQYVMLLGRLVPEKDAAILVRAFRQINTGLDLAIVGGSADTDEYEQELRSLAAADPRVHFLGYRYGESLDALLAHARLFVQPSLLEGLPITLLEAAGHGRPVVVSDIPPHLEVVRADGPGSRVFKAGDEASLRRALERALADPHVEETGARRLHDDVRARYDWDKAAGMLEDVYARAAPNRK